MAALGVIVDRLVSVWVKPEVRRSVPWMFFLITCVGSILKELELVPETYFSSSKNVFNVYFVKLSWGWTLLLLTPFLLLSHSSVSRSVSSLAKRLLSLAVATAVWYVCTETFFYIEDATGSCFDSGAPGPVKKDFSSKASCRRAGFHWDGFDISGHSFILAYSTLLIVEETAPMALVRTARLSALPRTVLALLYVALNLIVVMWVWMFACTSVYFHDPSHKLLGTACGLLGWFLTYRVWYLTPCSPGLPPRCRQKKRSNAPEATEH